MLYRFSEPKLISLYVVLVVYTQKLIQNSVFLIEFAFLHCPKVLTASDDGPIAAGGKRSA